MNKFSASFIYQFTLLGLAHQISGFYVTQTFLFVRRKAKNC